MIVKKLELSDYRNYKSLKIEFDKSTNILYGDNAQGKTNILESIYMCGTSRSHKSNKDKEIIRFGQDESHIKLLVEKKEKEYRIDMHLKNNKQKGIAIISSDYRMYSACGVLYKNGLIAGDQETV